MPADSLRHDQGEAADARLLESVRPADWATPEPRGRYDLAVVGGGTAGLVSAMGAAGLGARVALIERGRLGGDCLNTGCVPSKALLRSARAAADARRAPALGVRVAGIEVDFAAVMRRMRERRADIGPHDSASRLRAAGVDVYFGDARFTGPASIAVAGRTLVFRRAVIATGSRPAVPAIPGLDRVPFLTSDTLFELREQPARMAIIGGGAAGCEMAQAFARLGTAVTLLEPEARVLPREDADAAAIVARQLTADGVTIRAGAPVTSLPPDAGHVLVAAGRDVNVEGLDLAAAGVAADAHGVVVDDYLRTSNRRIFAAGDVCSSYKFTHAADAMARIVIRNALFFGRQRASALVIPWCTYTDPEVAHVGAYEDAARRAGRAVETITIPLADVDRAVV